MIQARDAVRVAAEADARARRLEAENERLRRLIEYDRTGLAAALAAVRRIVAGRSWIADPEQWGGYGHPERTVATLRGEIADALEEIENEAREALRRSGKNAASAFWPPEGLDVRTPE